jgi:hypothetical protein
MSEIIERLAVWYLNRQGVAVLPRAFIGFATGYCTAIKTGETGTYDEWQMVVPKIGKVIALNQSILISDPAKVTVESY